MLKKTLIVAASTAIMLSASAYAASTGRAETAFKKLDTNSDGVVSKDEFIAKTEAAFAKKDADSNGKITLEEFKARRAAVKEKAAEKKAATPATEKEDSSQLE